MQFKRYALGVLLTGLAACTSSSTDEDSSSDNAVSASPSTLAAATGEINAAGVTCEAEAVGPIGSDARRTCLEKAHDKAVRELDSSFPGLLANYREQGAIVCGAVLAAQEAKAKGTALAQDKRSEWVSYCRHALEADVGRVIVRYLHKPDPFLGSNTAEIVGSCVKQGESGGDFKPANVDDERAAEMAQCAFTLLNTHLKLSEGQRTEVESAVQNVCNKTLDLSNPSSLKVAAARTCDVQLYVTLVGGGFMGDWWNIR